MVSNLGRLSYNKGKRINLSVMLFARQFLSLILVSAGQEWMGECLLATGLLQDFPASSAGYCTLPSPALVPATASQALSKLKVKETCLCPEILVKLKALANAPGFTFLVLERCPCSCIVPAYKKYLSLLFLFPFQYLSDPPKV